MTWNTNLDIIGWFGQSNAVGTYLPVPTTTIPVQENMKIFAGDYRWYDSEEPCSYMQRNSGFTVDEVNYTPTAGYGSIKKFQWKYITLNPGREIGVVPCARGGTKIESWNPSKSDTTLFGATLKRLLAAKTHGNLVGMVFVQGEAETVSGREDYAQQWDAYFTTIVQVFRVQLGNPVLPFVYVQLGAYPLTGTYSNWDVVKQSQARVEQNVPYTKMVDMSDISPNYQELHYSPYGYNLMGDRIYYAMADLLEL